VRGVNVMIICFQFDDLKAALNASDTFLELCFYCYNSVPTGSC